MRNKVLRRTDFMAAARANQRATQRLVAMLLAILTLLGYLLGWGLQIGMGYYPPDAQSALFVSHWGINAALGLLIISSLWVWIAFRSGDRIVLRLTGPYDLLANTHLSRMRHP